MRKYFILLLLAVSASLSRADLITSYVTITNTAGTTNGQSITINGIARVFSNSVPNYLFIALGTNTSSTATNVYNSYQQTRQAGVTPFVMPSTNVLVFQGTTLAVTLSAGIGTVSNYTQYGTNLSMVGVPYTVYGSTERATLGNGVADWVNQATTTRIDKSHLDSTLADLGSIQTFSGLKTFSGGATISTILSAPSTSSTSTIQNLSVSNLTIQANGKVTGVITNSTAYNLKSINSTITNGLAQNLLVINSNSAISTALTVQSASTNSDSVHFQDHTGTRTAYIDDYGDFLTLGWVSVGGFTNSGTANFLGDVNIDGAATATINGAFNLPSVAGSQQGVLFVDTNGAVNSTAFGQVDGSGITNLQHGYGMTLEGTTTNNGTVSFLRTNNTGLANGNNANVKIGYAKDVFVSGPTAAFTINGISAPTYLDSSHTAEVWIWNRTGYNMTIANQSGTDPTPANRIQTGIGADMIFTNNPSIVHLRYDSVTARWAVF